MKGKLGIFLVTEDGAPKIGGCEIIFEFPVLDSSSFFTADGTSKQIPFELVLRIPRSGWHGLYSTGLRIALHSAVEQYRSYLAQANKI